MKQAQDRTLKRRATSWGFQSDSKRIPTYESQGRKSFFSSGQVWNVLPALLGRSNGEDDALGERVQRVHLKKSWVDEACAKVDKVGVRVGGWEKHSTQVAFLPLTQQPRFDSQRSQKNFRGKITDIAEVNQRCYLEESGQWLENVYQTHLVLASGKPVLQKFIKGLIKSLENLKSLLNSHKKVTKTF